MIVPNVKVPFSVERLAIETAKSIFNSQKSDEPQPHQFRLGFWVETEAGHEERVYSVRFTGVKIPFGIHMREFVIEEVAVDAPVFSTSA